MGMDHLSNYASNKPIRWVSLFWKLFIFAAKVLLKSLITVTKEGQELLGKEDKKVLHGRLGMLQVQEVRPKEDHLW